MITTLGRIALYLYTVIAVVLRLYPFLQEGGNSCRGRNRKTQLLDILNTEQTLL